MWGNEHPWGSAFLDLAHHHTALAAAQRFASEEGGAVSVRAVVAWLPGLHHPWVAALAAAESRRS
ncbi:hypothetical protein [Methylomagnum sp.]